MNFYSSNIEYEDYLIYENQENNESILSFDNENDYNSPFNDYRHNDNEDNFNELEKQMNEIELGDQKMKQNALLKSTGFSQKSTNNSVKKELENEEKPIIDVKLTNYHNQLKEDESQEKLEIVVESKTFLSNNKTNTKNSIKNNCINKFSDENLRRKCKHLTLDAFFDFINLKIFEINNGNIGKGIIMKQFQKLNMKQKSESNIKFNKEFLSKSLKDIFSDKISGRITNYTPDHNKKLIQSLVNESNIDIKIYFNRIFNLNFIQCLEHYRGTKNYEELKGMRVFNDEKKIFMDDENYVEALDYYLKNYENILKNKKSRNPKKIKKNKKNEN